MSFAVVSSSERLLTLDLSQEVDLSSVEPVYILAIQSKALNVFSLVLCWCSCRSVRLITHELFHSLGILHHHERVDRDLYIKINWLNIRVSIYEALNTQLWNSFLASLTLSGILSTSLKVSHTTASQSCTTRRMRLPRDEECLPSQPEILRVVTSHVQAFDQLKRMLIFSELSTPVQNNQNINKNKGEVLKNLSSIQNVGRNDILVLRVIFIWDT